MIITEQTKISLSQLFDLFVDIDIYILFRKHKISVKHLDIEFENYQTADQEFSLIQIISALNKVSTHSIGALVNEVICTRGNFRSGYSPKYVFDERWKDFEKCLLLDGFKIENEEVIRIEPLIESNTPVADDLTAELDSSHLGSANLVTSHIKLSAEAFTKTTPDYNACLSHSRIALETLVKNIAEYLGLNMDSFPDSRNWGSSLNYLNEKELISCKEEKVIASIYTVSVMAYIKL